MRITDLGRWDLALARWDFDLTFAALLMHADGTVYHRYGGRGPAGADQYLSLASLARLLRDTLGEHVAYAQRPSPPPARAPRLAIDLPVLQKKLARGQPIDCVHCHTVNDAEHVDAVLGGRWRREELWQHPDPARIGLTLDREHQAMVTAVAPGSPAAKAGIAPGDTLLSLGARVKRIDFLGMQGNDRLENATSIPSTFAGGTGSDTLIGGGGNDIFNASSGNDLHYGGGGQDVLYRNGYHGYFRDAASRPTDYDLTVGQVYTPAVGGLNGEELRAVGSVTASLDPNDKQRLILNGPSGAAIVLKAATWTKTASTFETSDAVKMETDGGDVPFTPALSGGKKTVVNLYGSPVSDAGNLFGITSGGVPVTSDGNDDLTTTIGQIMSATAALDLPQVSWGIKLGNEIRATDADAPLNPAVPYLYASYASNSGNSVETDMVRMNLPSHGSTFSGSVAYAPSDNTVYVTYGDYGLAVSANGYIPYTPDQIPYGVANPYIYGDIYLRGPVPLGDYELDGDIVLDLDANGDGQRSDLNADAVRNKLTRFARGIQSQAVDDYNQNGFGASILSDAAVGFNGTLSMGFVEGLLSVDVGNATAWYKPGAVKGATSQFAFRGSSPDPFEDMDKTQGVGQVLAKLGAPKYDVQGQVTWKQGSGGDFNWAFQASASTASLGGVLPLAGLTLYAGNTRYNGDAFYAQAYCQVAGVGSLVIEGSIAFEGESVYLYAQYNYKYEDFSGAFQSSVYMNTKIIVQWSKNVFTLGGSYSFTAWAKQEAVGEGRITINAALAVSVSGGAVSFSASGSIEISAWVYIVDWRPEAKAGFSLSDDSFSISIPGLRDLEFNW